MTIDVTYFDKTMVFADRDALARFVMEYLPGRQYQGIQISAIHALAQLDGMDADPLVAEASRKLTLHGPSKPERLHGRDK